MCSHRVDLNRFLSIFYVEITSLLHHYNKKFSTEVDRRISPYLSENQAERGAEPPLIWKHRFVPLSDFHLAKAKYDRRFPFEAPFTRTALRLVIFHFAKGN